MGYLHNKITYLIFCHPGPRNRHLHYPQFSSDSQYIIMTTLHEVEVYSAVDGQKVNEYEITDPIKDFHVSKKSGQLAVMTGK